MDWGLDFCHLMFDGKFTCFHAALITNALLSGVDLDACERAELVTIESVRFKTVLSFLIFN